jgi:hypothetical protein
VADNDDVNMNLFFTAHAKNISKMYAYINARSKGVATMIDRYCYRSQLTPWLRYVLEGQGFKCRGMFVWKKVKLNETVSYRMTERLWRGHIDLLHRVIARIKVCADEERKEGRKRERFSEGGAINIRTMGRLGLLGDEPIISESDSLGKGFVK